MYVCFISMYFKNATDNAIKYSLVWAYIVEWDDKVGGEGLTDEFQLLQRDSATTKFRGLPIKAAKYINCKVTERPKKVGNFHVTLCTWHTDYLQKPEIISWEQRNENSEPPT